MGPVANLISPARYNEVSRNKNLQKRPQASHVGPGVAVDYIPLVPPEYTSTGLLRNEATSSGLKMCSASIKGSARVSL